MTSHMRTFAVLASTLVVAGCGSKKDDKSASYKTDYKAESATIKALGNEIGEAITTAKQKSDDQIVAQFQALATRTHVAAGALAGLTPPADLKAENAALQTALERAAADLDEIVKAARAHSYNDAKTATEALIGDSTVVKSARDELEAATK